MKFRTLLIGAIFVCGSLISRAQVFEMYNHGFETSETPGVRIVPTTGASYDNTLAASGSRSIKLTQLSDSDVEMITDTIDFSQNTTLRYIAIEFDHINNISVPAGQTIIGQIYVKRASQGDDQWTQVTGLNHYDISEGNYSAEFRRTSSFHRMAYSDWNSNVMTNDNWHHERFNVNDLITPSTATAERKLLIKFVLKSRLSGSAAGMGWWIDNLTVRSSQSQMVTPTITMRCYPDGTFLPSSRGARIELDATTTVSQGINPDSVYLYYKVGERNAAPIRIDMQPVSGVANRYQARIPFEGYDTLMQFYCVARDATTNANSITFPRAANSWVSYRCVRGSEQLGVETPGFVGTSNSTHVPFPPYYVAKSEWVYDSALLHDAGYDVGGITDMRFTVAATNSLQARNQFQIRMKNAPTSHSVPTDIYTNFPYTSGYMHIVYDSTLVIPEMGAGATMTIHLQDTFFYAGKDIIMQMIYYNETPTAGTTVKAIAAPATKSTIFQSMGSMDVSDPYTTPQYEYADERNTTRPAFVLTEHKNQPLLYDLGVEAFLMPTYYQPITSQPASIQVRLKNYGALTANAVRITYIIDNATTGHFDWSGSLAGQASVNVTLTSSVNLSAGYHTLKAWVEDTLTASGSNYRDHEPYNDTCFTEFIVCAGPMSGTRRVGGSGADYNTIEELLYSLSRCGVDDSLIVRLTAGSYPPFTMPAIPGTSDQNYIVFQPVSGNVTFYADETTGSTEIVNVDSADHIYFRNIKFVRRSGALSNMVMLGMESHGCHFENCTFVDSLANASATMRISSLLHTGFSNNVVVSNCTFTGGNTGLSLMGQASDILSSGCVVKGCKFSGQYTTGLSVQNQSGVLVERNEVYDVLSNSSYVFLMYECYGQTRVLANKFYTSHGAGAVGVSNVHGTSAQHLLIANNMVVCDDDGTANLLRSPFNIIQGEWMDVLYNSVQMRAPNRTNIAAATFGGGVLSNSRFINNIAASLDDMNFAFNFLPGSETSNSISNNIYYSTGATLNRWSGTSYSTLADWASATGDSLSAMVNPVFLNGSLVDLRTYSRLVKGVGVPMTEMTVDMFDTLRSTTATCPGAFEFTSLFYDYEPEALLQPGADNCSLPNEVELVVRLRNNGVNAYDPTGSVPLKVAYRVNNNATQQVTCTRAIPGEDTIEFHTGRMLSLPPSGLNDATYTIKVWTISANDPNQTNDTNVFSVISRYHPGAPNDVAVAVNYGATATITPAAGIDNWAVYNSTAAPRRNSTIYWYAHPEDEGEIAVGPTFTTGALRQDTNLYFRQRRNMPIVRMTQVQLLRNNNTIGLSNPMPVWMASGTKVAIQLTNVGDGAAHLNGDTLMTVSPTSNLNNKLFIFGDVDIEPGESLVVQWTSGTTNFPTYTVHTGTSVTPNYNANIAFVYRRNGVVEDAVPFNDVISASSTQAVRWSTQNVPNYVWTGGAIQVPNNTVAGYYRTAFNGNQSDWTLATATSPMFLDNNNPSWVRYEDNGCLGNVGTATVTIIAPPSADIELTNLQVPEGCGLSQESISVDVANYGSAAVNPLVLNYSAGGSVVSETVSGGIAAGGSMTYTFSQTLDMTVDHDSLFALKVWATAVSGDPQHDNDTIGVEVLSRMTPAAPTFASSRNVQYATRDTLFHTPADGLIPVWYNSSMEPVDTGYTYVSDIMYMDQTIGVGYVVGLPTVGQVGFGTSLNGKTAYPCPYQPNSKYVKQQYIYSAHELTAAGLMPGPINSVAFYLDSIWANRDSMVFDDYYISIGTTEDTIFGANTDWKSTQIVYHREPMVLYQSDVNTWVSHTFDIPFTWDGVSSVVVQVAHRNTDAVNSGVQVQYTAKPSTTLHKNNASELSPSTLDFSGAGTKGNNRPNIRISNVTYGCLGPVAPIQIHVEGVPAVDVSIAQVAGQDTMEYSSCSNVEINVGVFNLGLNTLNSVKIKYQIDASDTDSTVVPVTLTSGQYGEVQLFSLPLLPGRHSVLAVLANEGDAIVSNDTVRIGFVVRFCSGNYTIAAETGDFHSFSEAIDSLNVVGIDGSITFNVAAGVYQEQVTLNEVAGSSASSIITFSGMGDEKPLLTASTSQTDNYVFQMDGASNVVLRNLRIEARPTANNVNYANALLISNADNVKLQNNDIKVKGTINNQNASCIIVGDNVSNLVMQSNTVDSGYYSLRVMGDNHSDFVLRDNQFMHFWFRGIDVRNIENLDVSTNRIQSGVTVSSRAMIGLNVSQAEGTTMIQRNHIYIVDDKNGGKRGIQLNNVKGSQYNWVYVKNNMVSTSGIGIAGLNPVSGIYIDSSSSYINIYYNSVRVSAHTATNPVQVNSNAFFAGATTSHLQVMNNIFANQSRSYAYYVTTPSNVTSSNFNNYYSEGENIVYWASPRADLTALQTANGDDGSSLADRPYFFGADNLHLLMTNFVDKAQYNTDVTEDIDGTMRPQIPAPTIGAHEMPRQTHDMSIVEIIEPQMPATTAAPNNVESDSVLVKASFYNNGIATETNVRWYAYIEGHEATTTSAIRNLGTFQSSMLKTDSVMMPTVLGIIDTQRVHVVLLVTADSNMADNDLTTPIYLAPAYNLEAVRMTAPSGCELQDSPISITLKNAGHKDIPAGVTVEIGYSTQGYHPSYTPSNPSANKINISTMVDTVKEYHVFETMLPQNATRTLTFNTHANLYPTDNALNIKVRVSGWCHYQYDVTLSNDSTGYQTSSSPAIDAYYTPDPPEGHDTTLAYGTWGAVTAAQVNNRPIRWYRDSTASPFYTGNNYAVSTRWSNTPQYFHDSTYYLNCLSDKSCPSHFSSVNVHVAPRIANDMAFEAVLAPLGSRVFMSNDTVRVRIANYGTLPQNNFPITYELKRGNTLLQHVTQLCTQTIAAGQTYEFTFDSLLDTPTPTANQNYTLTVWTDLATDGTRRNDTIRVPYTFKTLAEGTYCSPSNGADGVVNITRVAFNEIDFDIPPLGRSYTNLGTYANPEQPALHVMRGTTDSIFVMPYNMTGSTRPATVDIGVYIDFDRSGTFSEDELVSYTANPHRTGELFRDQITIPQSASYGYMKMRVVACNTTVELSPCLEADGHVVDFLLYVEPEPAPIDVAFTQIASPRNFIIDRDTTFAITFRMANKGTEHLSNVEVFYRFDADVMDSTSSGSFQWTGSLMPGASTEVTLPVHTFPLGTTVVNIWHNTPGDADTANNHLLYEYNRFHVITLSLTDNFDDTNFWYAPTGYNAYSRNYWQRGVPNKTRIYTAFSEPNAWVTDLNASTIVTGKRGNVSYLYSPIINIARIRPDTLSFRLLRNLTNGSSVHLEYYNYEGNWVNVETDSMPNWYNNSDANVFDGTSSGNAYNRYWISTSLISGDFESRLQFRFVYTTPQGSSDNSGYGEGCAIDDFRIGRARRAVDAGVVAITKPTAPKYGQTIYPEVLVKNYGFDTLREVTIGFTYFGHPISLNSTYTCLIPPGEIDTFTMTESFIITNAFPDTFNITAFTINSQDIYYDNDTNSKLFRLSPLENDISAESFIAPLDNVIAGDTAVTVTMRIRNFGENPIYTATASYLVNGANRVDEDIDFEDILGRPLDSMEYFNYTFQHKFRAPMGVTYLTGIIKDDANEYIYNDTITKKVMGISSIMDLAAAGIIIDTTSYTDYGVQLIIENQGARGANGFEVGFWIDNDTTTIHREVWGHEFPLPAFTTGSHLFSITLPQRPAGYEYVTGYVKVLGDNDPSNDTTNLLVQHRIDLKAEAIIVEENAAPDCYVYVQMSNLGNYSIYGRNIKINATVNGHDMLKNTTELRIEPGQTIKYRMPEKVAKDSLRHYSGYLKLTMGSDADPTNDESSNLILMNYVEDVPDVNAGQLVLEQNYPNPFSHQTAIPFTLPNASTVRFFVMDAMGHILSTTEKFYPAGSNTLTIDMTNYSAGVYYYGIEVDGTRQMRKMILH